MFNVFLLGLSSADFVAFVNTLNPKMRKWVLRGYNVIYYTKAKKN